MAGTASQMAGRLARQAEAVCRHYLPRGRREGSYWRAGDVTGAPGASLYVRLTGEKSGKWADAATGEHGDLLDLIAAHQGLNDLSQTLDEARRFLALPRPAITAPEPAPSGSPQAARRLFAGGRALGGTPAEAYLRSRGLESFSSARWLRFHPRCFYRDEVAGVATWPALLAAATDIEGEIQGLQRIWLTRGGAKAPVRSPRRAMGTLLGHAVRFGHVQDVLVAGEGLETVLSVREAFPSLPAAAALSAAHLAALALPQSLRRLYIARDEDLAGLRAADRLADRAEASGVEAIQLRPRLDDVNDDLRRYGRRALARALTAQLHPEDRARFGARP
jgi:hypothetical protein